MHYYLVRAETWNEDEMDVKNEYCVVSGDTYGQAAEKVEKGFGEELVEFSIMEMEDWSGLLFLEEDMYDTLKEGR